MTDERGSLREILWQEICPWLILARGLRVSLRFRVLVLAAAGVIATAAGWRLVGDMFSGTENPTLSAWIEVDSAWPWDAPVARPTLADQTLRTSQVVGSVPLIGGQLVSNPNINPLDAWLRLAWPFVRLFDAQRSFAELTYLLLCGIWEIVVWAIFGGAITRIAALELTRRESLGVRAAVSQTTGRIGSYLTAALLPLFAIGCVALVPFVIGLVGRMSFFLWLAGLFWFLLLFLGFALAVLTIGYLVGWPFLFATLSVERTDAFDALSRSYAYVFQRPLRLLFYTVVAVFLGMLGGLVVYVFATATESLTDWSVRWGAGRDRMEFLHSQASSGEPPESAPYAGEAGLSDDASPSDASESGESSPSIESTPLLRGAGNMRYLWVILLRSLMAAYPVGFLWISGTAIYLLLRRDIDAAEMDEVALEDQENAYGLPPLQEDATGVPQAVEPEADNASQEPSDSSSSADKDRTDG